ncbi:MAG TPA: hypothetical protein VMH02_05675, partial [Verrucomicrobiae bacterium]|nr:hypothetical protein [Verrucomicrobiae bacterium]
MSDVLAKSLLFLAIALVTMVLAYLYQRHERPQALNRIWLWPLIFALLAARSIAANWPIDAQLWQWMAIGFVVGLILGTARGFAFGVRSGEKPGTILLRPNLLSGAIFMIALLYNEFWHVFRWGDPRLPRFACAMLVLTVGNSIAA